MGIIDFHSHILPGVDDGSKSIEMTTQMLSLAAAQGVTTMVATPHFYASKMEVDRFLSKRQAAYESIKDVANGMGIEIRLGAEVAFFRSLFESNNLDDFLIQGCNEKLLLLEMPFAQWGKRELQTIEGIIDRGVTPILAHIDRFFSYQKNKQTLDEILEMDVICQYNADSVFGFWSKGKILKRIDKDDRVIIGSDCHNTSNRQPNIGQMRRIIIDKLGEEKFNSITEFSKSLLE